MLHKNNILRKGFQWKYVQPNVLKEGPKTNDVMIMYRAYGIILNIGTCLCDCYVAWYIISRNSDLLQKQYIILHWLCCVILADII